MYENNEIYQSDVCRIAQLNLPWDKIKNKIILISGASGLIGSFIVDVLMYRNNNMCDNIQIIALGRNKDNAVKRFDSYWNHKNFKFIAQDINKSINNMGDVHYIIHAASNTHPVAYSTDPVGTMTTNLFGTYNLLEYGQKNSLERFVYLSTVEIYGENQGDTDSFDENYCGYINCNTTRAGYPESKRAGESMCCAFASKYDMDIVIPRLCRIYGPTMMQSDSKALSQFIKNSINGQDIILKSEGNQFFSYCYTADAVSGILTIMLSGDQGQAYNVADSNSDITLKDLAQLIAKNSGTKVIFELPNQIESAGFSKATKAILNPSKLNKLGWKAFDNIETGIEKTISILKSESNQ